MILNSFHQALMARHISVGALPLKGSQCELLPETLREPFHGALLGLWLAPIAVSLMGASRSIAHDSAGMDGWDPKLDSQEMAATLADGFTLIQAFASEADAFRQPLSALLRPVLLETPLADVPFEGPGARSLPVWLVSLPVLLRYHDSRSLRLRWLDAQASSLRELAHANHLPWAVAAKQIMQLGDFLEMALSGWTDPLLDYVTELRGERSSSGTSQTATVQPMDGDEADGDEDGDEFAKVLISAFGGSPADFFGLEALFPPALLRTCLCRSEQMLLIGLLAGALRGASQLPVLWQMTGCASAVYSFESKGIELESPELDGRQRGGRQIKGNVASRAAIVRMANQLFDQWAGIQPI